MLSGKGHAKYSSLSSPGLICGVIEMCTWLGDVDAAHRAATYFSRRPGRFPESVLVAAIEEVACLSKVRLKLMQEGGGGDGAAICQARQSSCRVLGEAVRTLAGSLVARLERETAIPIPPITDWTVEYSMACR
jgi:hypothetical protein